MEEPGGWDLLDNANSIPAADSLPWFDLMTFHTHMGWIISACLTAILLDLYLPRDVWTLSQIATLSNAAH